MKKIVIGMVTLGICMVELAGCDMLGPEQGETPVAPAEKTGVELVKEMLEKLPEAKKIEQTIEIKAAGGTKITQY